MSDTVVLLRAISPPPHGYDELRRRLERLTGREREVLSLIASGWSNREAAAELAISEITVQVHRRRVMQKMAARSFADLLRFANQLQLPRQLRWRPTRAFVLPREVAHA